ncbi:hypothetical protein [Streptomyces sp. NPDC003036]|uniref:hypothetical protein n=1 Tax=Streptomyces sp. NPDC003036 TaxID=3154442 RepID=UPI0033A91436
MPSRAVIVDRDGESDPEDWDSAVLYDGESPSHFPDRVLVRDPLAERLRRSSPELRSEETGGGLTLFAPGPVRPL